MNLLTIQRTKTPREKKNSDQSHSSRNCLVLENPLKRGGATEKTNAAPLDAYTKKLGNEDGTVPITQITDLPLKNECRTYKGRQQVSFFQVSF